MNDRTTTSAAAPGIQFAAAALAASAGLALGQSFNIEIGDSSSTASGTVPSTYAACAQPGHWNSVVSESPSGILLRNLSNQLTSVIMVRPTGQTAVTPAGNSDSGTFRNVMADGIPVNPATNVDAYTFTGLESGSYLVYVYFTNTSVPGAIDASIDATGFIGQSLEVDSGSLANRYRAGGNYSVTRATVGANGQLTVRAFRNTPGKQANVAAMQLVKLGGGRKLVYVNATATGDNSGTSWANGINGLVEPVQMLQAMHFLEAENAQNTTVDFDLWVAKGTYFATEDTSFFNPDRDGTLTVFNGTRILGGFEGTEVSPADRTFAPGSETVVTGEIGGFGPSDNSYTLATLINCGPSTLIDHVTFANGYDDQSTLGFLDGRGGAVEMYRTSGGTVPGAVFRGVTFQNNAAYREGGAVWTSFSNARFEDCVFTGNSAQIPGNSDADGGAVYAEQAEPEFIRTDFIQNRAADDGSAVYADGNGGTLQFLSVRALGNTGAASTLYFENTPSNLANTLVAGNSHSFARGAVQGFGESADIRLENCTIAWNNGFNGSGVALSDGADVTCLNTIIFGNSTTGVSVNQLGDASIHVYNGPSTGTFAYSSIEHGTAMSLVFNTASFANNTDDPEFLDPTGPDNILGNADDDYRLALGSAAQDTGDINFAPTDDFDLDGDGTIFEEVPFDLLGNPRIVDLAGVGKSGFNTIDRGAYESIPFNCPADYNHDGVAGDIFDLFDFLADLDTGLDYNGDTIQSDIFDLFDFLAVLDAGCD